MGAQREVLFFSFQTSKAIKQTSTSNLLKRRLDTQSPLTPISKTTRWLKSNSLELPDLEGDTLIGREEQQLMGSTKKSKTPAKKSDVRKRRKQSEGYVNMDDTVVNTSSEAVLADDTQSTTIRQQAMPPPAKPDVQPGSAKAFVPQAELIDRELRYNTPYGNASFSSDELLARNQIGPNNRLEVSPQRDYDLVQQYIDMQPLPPRDNLWTDDETDLFHGLSTRGLQPLFPSNWSVDFRTLPPQLFAKDDETPLITALSHPEFDAKYFLRLLFEIASRVRDRAILEYNVQEAIREPLSLYIDWALKDAGVHKTQRPHVIPIHAVVVQRRNETTKALIRRMQTRLYRLAMRYQATHFLSDSIDDDDDDSDDACSTASSQYDENRMPTLFGIMIASSLVAFVTLNSKAVHPDIAEPFKTPANPFKPSNASSTAAEPQASPLNIIAKFDFSEHEGYDVWDGLALAIAVMRIRRTMIELAKQAEIAGDDGPGGTWEKLVEEEAEQDGMHPQFKYGYAENGAGLSGPTVDHEMKTLFPEFYAEL